MSIPCASVGRYPVGSAGFPATPLVALKVLDAGVLAVTLLTAATWLPWLVIELPAGAWVDRLPCRRCSSSATPYRQHCRSAFRSPTQPAS